MANRIFGKSITEPNGIFRLTKTGYHFLISEVTPQGQVTRVLKSRKTTVRENTSKNFCVISLTTKCQNKLSISQVGHMLVGRRYRLYRWKHAENSHSWNFLGWKLKSLNDELVSPGMRCRLKNNNTFAIITIK